MSVPELVAFHTAIVVRDIEKSIERYRGVLGVDRWHFWDRTPPGSPMRVAYGGGAGATFELIGVTGEGDSQFHRFLTEHGEGVQHIGFWAPDMRAAITAAVEAGGQIVSGAMDENGNAVVQVTPANIETVQFRNPTFIDAGVGFTVEYFGRGGDQMLRDWFKDEFEIMITPPPW
jgi:catechol 2,3-dioxygenase-like lactoylglutathione lyase family enzyme